MSASFKIVGRRDVALIGIDVPPVNILDRATRADLLECLTTAENDPSVKALVLKGARGAFVTGADLSEFEEGIGEPSYRSLMTAVEQCGKPVVAVLEGATLGAGLELALACHVRVAAPGARFGMPEITLGLVPGAGGTQRLPRLVGMRAALDMLLGGKAISAPSALEIGLIDAIVQGDPLAAGIACAERLIAEKEATRRTCDLTVAPLDDEQAEQALADHRRALKGRTTQHAALAAVRAAAGEFEMGLDAEQGLSEAAIRSRESEALRHVFFAERRAGRAPSVVESAGEPPQRAAVVGTGTMGSGIAVALNNAGFEVTMVGARGASLSRGLELIAGIYRTEEAKGRSTAEQARERIAAITGTTDAGALADADLVIETITEDLGMKVNVLRTIAATVRPDAIIATNTSSLSVTELADACPRPERVVGMHFFSPPHIMPLLEVVRAEQTSDGTLAVALGTAKRMKKIAAVSRDGFGFIGNRMMLDGAYREGEQMMLEGAGVAQIDAAIEAFGFAMGQSRVNDMAGVDIGTKCREQLALRGGKRSDPYCAVSDALVAMGRTGQKTGRGFYDYPTGGGRGTPAPEVDDTIRRLAEERGIKRRAVAEDEIQERFVLQLVNVGAAVLEEGVARSSADIDVVWVHGFGFPRHLGGPMFYADTLGLPHVLDRIRSYEDRLGAYWKPSPLLISLVGQGMSFADYDRRARTGGRNR